MNNTLFYDIITGGVKSINNSTVSYVGEDIFKNCKILEQIYFSQCISTSFEAFQGCTNLISASFPKCTIIGSYTFASCSNLTTISFPKCTTINNYAFMYCSSLSVISFPKCTTIDASAFYRCSNLISAYFLTSAVPTLNSNAFSNTPITNSTYLGYYGSVYVLSSMVNAFKSADYWSLISDRITAYTE